MGLAIEVGMLADLIENDEEGAEWLRESLANLNAVLAEQHLPPHVEPEILPQMDNRSILESFPYSFLHHLRRAYARWKQDPESPILPCAPDENPAADLAVDEESSMLESHLLCHSDCEGFYIPIPFDGLLVDENDQGRIVGGLLGSSYRLRDELISLAPGLGIHLDNGELSDSVIARIESDITAESGLWIERGVWLTLFEAARLSIAHRSAICFT